MTQVTDVSSEYEPRVNIQNKNTRT